MSVGTQPVAFVFSFDALIGRAFLRRKKRDDEAFPKSIPMGSALSPSIRRC